MQSIYKVLSTLDSVERDGIFPSLWKIKCLPIAKHFTWRVLRGKVATLDNLSRRGVVHSNNVCPLCKSFSETINHFDRYEIFVIGG